MGRLAVEQLDSVEQLRAVAAEWDRLWTQSEASHPTARAELVAQWLEHFAPHATPRVLVVEDEGRMVAALPLVGHRRRGVLPVGDLTWNYWSPNGELLLDPAADTEAVLDVLAGAIARLPWPLLWLELTPFATGRWQALLDALRRRGLAVHVQPRYEIGQVELAGCFANYEATRSRDLRRSLRKDLQRLQRKGPVQLTLVSQFAPGDVEPQLRRAVEIEQKSWKREVGQTVLDTPGMLEFYLRQTRQLAEWGLLRLAFLEHAGKPIAFELGWVAKGVYHSFKVGFDQAYRSFGPGQLLRGRLIEALFDAPDVQVVDFQGPLTEALAGWSTRTYAIGRVLIARPSFVGKSLLGGYPLAASIVRRWRGPTSDSRARLVSLPDSRETP